jgi:hypothetical protein
MGYVYFIHYEPKLFHANHYIGYSDKHPLEGRISEHIKKTVKGSPLIKAALENGSKVVNIRIWPNKDRKFERYLKNYGKTRYEKFCPYCKSTK